MIEQRPRTFTVLTNNECTVLVSGRDSGGAYCVLEFGVPPGGGGNSLHTDPFLETFYVLDGELEFTLEREGKQETFRPAVGESVYIDHGVRHKFTCVGDKPARALAIALPGFEEYMWELAVAWPHKHWDPVATPAAMAPVAKKFDVIFVNQ